MEQMITEIYSFQQPNIWHPKTLPWTKSNDDTGVGHPYWAVDGDESRMSGGVSTPGTTGGSWPFLAVDLGVQMALDMVVLGITHCEYHFDKQ